MVVDEVLLVDVVDVFFVLDVEYLVEVLVLLVEVEVVVCLVVVHRGSGRFAAGLRTWFSGDGSATTQEQRPKLAKR